MTTPFPLVLGLGAVGFEKWGGARINDEVTAQKVLDGYLAVGNTLDTARIYAGGTSEQLTSKLDIKGANIDTKIYPVTPGTHKPENLRKKVQESLEALAPHKINVLYLHAPDRTVPFVDIAREVNEMHKEGLFREFGLSNFYAWEVAEFYYIAEKNGWVKPTVYQGVYSALERQVEAELFPFLTKFGIRFYAYSPLAAGVLAGKNLQAASNDGSRFDATASAWIAELFVGRYERLVPAAREILDAAAKHDITPVSFAFRWLQHHSKLKSGDAIIIGPSSFDQFEKTVKAQDGGPLPEDVVKAVDNVYAKTQGLLVHYAAL